MGTTWVSQCLMLTKCCRVGHLMLAAAQQRDAIRHTWQGLRVWPVLTSLTNTALVNAYIATYLNLEANTITTCLYLEAMIKQHQFKQAGSPYTRYTCMGCMEPVLKRPNWQFLKVFIFVKRKAKITLFKLVSLWNQGTLNIVHNTLQKSPLYLS